MCQVSHMRASEAATQHTPLSNHHAATTTQQPPLSTHHSAPTTQHPPLSTHHSATTASMHGYMRIHNEGVGGVLNLNPLVLLTAA